jgi:hypothetical protein
MENGTGVQRRFASIPMELYKTQAGQTIGMGGQKKEENVTLNSTF